ncbi:MAG: response regulator [Cyclobacteriaceae bacterium]
MNALIVDDEEDIGLMISMFLKKEGLKADFTSRITSAKEMIEKKNYQLFFLDLNLPDGTGFDLIPTIKEREASAKIVIISAYDSVDETQKAMDLGANIFIKKPFTKNEVINAVRTLA